MSSSDLIPGLVCERVFLGWERPLLVTAAEFLLSRPFSGSAPTVTLDGWTFVLPTSQAVTRFRELLSLQATQTGLTLGSVAILTSGDFAETLYRPERPIAIEFEQTLAWTRVLRSRDADTLRPLLPVLPEGDSVASWLELAGTLRHMTSDLATHDVTFSDVLKETETDAEHQRWKLLESLHASYLDELRSAGLADPFEQRRRAVTRRSVHAPGPVALIGTSDLNPSIVRLVEQIDREVLSLIGAPKTRSDDFDWAGRLRTEAFLNSPLPLRDEQLVAASDIGDQADAVTEMVHSYASRHAPDQIAVGVTDPSQIAPTEIQLEASEFEPYRHVGWTISATSVGKLIDLAGDFVARRTWQSLAALVRHGDVYQFLRDQFDADAEDFLISLDRLIAESFPVGLSDTLSDSSIQRSPIAVELRDKVLRWMAPLLGRPQTFGDWCTTLREWIATVYAGLESGVPVPEDRLRTSEAYRKVCQILDRFGSLNQRLDEKVSGAAALDALSGRLADGRVALERQSGQISIHGWLDLPLNDSAAMVIVGLNHPFVPSAVTSDPFLPGSLRAKLRLADNERRYARDVFAMQQILSSRSADDVRLIVGKRSADGSPTPPSRLIAAAPAEDVARRVRLLLDGQRDSVTLPSRWGASPQKSRLPVPSIEVDECPVKSMSVTAFKSYLECPFRFYLRHVLKLKPLDDAASEMAANQFGDLVHGAVEYFGQSDQRDETQESKIYDALRHHLDVYVAQHYGSGVRSAVTLQIRQAEQRLRFVAAAQAKRIDDGWKIHATEASVNDADKAFLTVDGRKMGLRGRFDRIDKHEEGGWAILDYKTHGHKPEKKHLRKNRDTGREEWIDLQLPLYRRMIPFLDIDAKPAQVQLGYFNVSDKQDETLINIANFSESQLEQADLQIEDCVRRIHRCDFTPNDDPVQYDDYEMILQTGVASRMLSASSQLDGEADR